MLKLVTVTSECNATSAVAWQLGAGERQQHMVAWERRKAVDKTLSIGICAASRRANASPRRCWLQLLLQMLPDECN